MMTSSTWSLYHFHRDRVKEFFALYSPSANRFVQPEVDRIYINVTLHHLVKHCLFDFSNFVRNIPEQLRSDTTTLNKNITEMFVSKSY